MDIRPIKTEADYEAALSEVEALFNSEPNTPGGDRLEVLVTLVEAYEEQHFAIPAPDPVEAVNYFMESRGLECRGATWSPTLAAARVSPKCSTVGGRSHCA
jgi:HTH-type transcriptional regulator/antitoxin HigA